MQSSSLQSLQQTRAIGWAKKLPALLARVHSELSAEPTGASNFLLTIIRKFFYWLTGFITLHKEFIIIIIFITI